MAVSEELQNISTEEFDTDEGYQRQKYLVLIIYDISDDKHRLHIAKYLTRFANRVQKSAFEAFLTRVQYDKLIKGLKALILESDDIRIYRISGNGDVLTFGVAEYRSEEDDRLLII